MSDTREYWPEGHAEMHCELERVKLGRQWVQTLREEQAEQVELQVEQVVAEDEGLYEPAGHLEM